MDVADVDLALEAPERPRVDPAYLRLLSRAQSLLADYPALVQAVTQAVATLENFSQQRTATRRLLPPPVDAAAAHGEPAPLAWQGPAALQRHALAAGAPDLLPYALAGLGPRLAAIQDDRWRQAIAVLAQRWATLAGHAERMRRVTESAVLAAASSGAAAAAAADALAAYRASPQGRGDCAPAGAGTVGGALALQAVFSRDVAGACAVLAESWAALMRDLADDLAPRAALLDPLIQARHDPTQLRADSGATSDGRTPLSAQQRDQQVTQLQLAWSELDEHALDESEAGEAIARIQFPV